MKKARTPKTRLLPKARTPKPSASSKPPKAPT